MKTESTEAQIRRFTEADDEKVASLMACCREVDRRRWGTHPGEAADAAVELIKCGMRIEDITSHLLSVSADVADLGYNLNDAAELVATACAAFTLDVRATHHVPQFVRLTAEKARRVR